jgi:tetratricopeptide (TPR) repeat protein
MRFLPALAICGWILAIPMAALAQAERYESCLDLVESQPLAAYEEALAWEAQGGGAPAKHCIASALLAMGSLQRGADRLEDLGHAPDLMDDRVRVGIFDQAAEAFLQLHQPDRALRSIEAGLKLRPHDLELQIKQARALSELGKETEARTALDKVLRARPSHLLALRLRATLLVELGELGAAGRDVDRAMALAPTNVDVLLLRGAYREAVRTSGRP